MRNLKNTSIVRLFVHEIKNGHTISGLIVILISVSLLILLSAFSSWIRPHNYNEIQTIKDKGIQTEATITDLKIYEQIRINGNSPTKVTYAYFFKGELRSDYLWTLDKLQHGIGEKISILVKEDKSIIQDVQALIFPIRFIFYIFYWYLFLGVAFVITGIIPFIKKYALYKYGSIRDAKMISIYPLPGFDLEKKVWVNYTFRGKDEKVIFGKSRVPVKHLHTQPLEKIKILVSNKNEKNSCLMPLEEMTNRK